MPFGSPAILEPNVAGVRHIESEDPWLFGTGFPRLCLRRGGDTGTRVHQSIGATSLGSGTP